MGGLSVWFVCVWFEMLFVCVVCVCGWCVVCVCIDFKLFLWMINLCGKHSQAESVAGAAHLPNDYAGVLKATQMRKKISCGSKEEKLA